MRCKRRGFPSPSVCASACGGKECVGAFVDVLCEEIGTRGDGIL